MTGQTSGGPRHIVADRGSRTRRFITHETKRTHWMPRTMPAAGGVAMTAPAVWFAMSVDCGVAATPPISSYSLQP